MQFTQIKQDTFNNLQKNAGILVSKFDPTGVTPLSNDDIIASTTGGISASCVATYVDLGEGIDNAPKNMKELKEVDSWECKMSGTFVGADLATIKMLLGAADIDSTNGKVTPRSSLKLTDFTSVWWLGDKGDGGMYAIKLDNALNTGGFSLQTTDKGNGTFGFELTGHVSINSQDVVPMEFYVGEPVSAIEVNQGE